MLGGQISRPTTRGEEGCDTTACAAIWSFASGLRPAPSSHTVHLSMVAEAHVYLVAPKSPRSAFGTSQLLLDEKPTMPFAKPAGKQQGAARASSHEDCVP